MKELTGDGLMTLTMVREVFPYFKRLLEDNTFIVGEDEVTVKVEEGPQGTITLWTTVRKRDPDARGE